MDPVITKSPYHHVLLMRDDKEVVTFRVHSKVLWYSLAGSIILIALGVTGTIFGVKSWQKNHSLRAKYEAAQTELSEARLKLEQLSNLQTLISTSDAPAPVFKFNEIQMPLQQAGDTPQENGTSEGNGDQPNTPPQANTTSQANNNSTGKTGNGASIPNGVASTTETALAFAPNGAATSAQNADNHNENVAANGAETTSPDNRQATGESADTDKNTKNGANESESSQTQGNGPEGASSANNTDSAGTGDTGDTGDTAPKVHAITDETSPVRINNLSTKAANRNRIQLSFDLLTNKQDAFVRGQATYQIILQDGTIRDIQPNFLDDSRFAISRMKNFDLTANLPKGVRAKQIKNIVVLVTLDSGETFTSTYPFAP